MFETRTRGAIGRYKSINDYIIKAKNIASRSASIGFPIEDREVVYHVVWGLHERFEKVAAILRAQRSLKLEEVQQALTEEETRIEPEIDEQVPEHSRD